MNPSIPLELQQTGDEKRRSFGSIQSRTVWKPQPHWLLAKPQPGVRRASATQGGQDLIPGSEIPPYIYNSSETGDKNGGPPNRYRPARCGNPNPTGFLPTLNLGCLDPAAPGEDNMSSPDHKSFHTFTITTNRGGNGGAPWVDTAPHDGETPTWRS